ncbi:Reverse transcriptase zinc-binding domain - like 5 [Theobroma cacao]|nr:Reverse transcriptase zinc-binding domain - like 5 [Theobroma cacao]
MMEQGMGFLIGNDRKIDFWNEQWIDGIKLKDEFPRVYALAIKKNGTVDNFGKYSIKSYCRHMMEMSHEKDSLWSDLWKGLAPLKVEVFGWMLIRGRVVVKENLLSRGILNSAIACCAICYNFLKIPRAVNGTVDYLAKVGVERNNEFLWVLADNGEDCTIPHEMLEH